MMSNHASGKVIYIWEQVIELSKVQVIHKKTPQTQSLSRGDVTDVRQKQSWEQGGRALRDSFSWLLRGMWDHWPIRLMGLERESSIVCSTKIWQQVCISQTAASLFMDSRQYGQIETANRVKEEELQSLMDRWTCCSEEVSMNHRYQTFSSEFQFMFSTKTVHRCYLPVLHVTSSGDAFKHSWWSQHCNQPHSLSATISTMQQCDNLHLFIYLIFYSLILPQLFTLKKILFAL